MQLSFFGADHEVTGSCHYLQACGKKILIDCGMQQGPDEYEHQELPVAPGEIDFVLQCGMEIIPVETKGGDDKSAPTFKKYVADNHPLYAVRFSKMGYRKDGNITNIPLYLVGKTKELLGG